MGRYPWPCPLRRTLVCGQSLELLCRAVGRGGRCPGLPHSQCASPSRPRATADLGTPGSPGTLATHWPPSKRGRVLPGPLCPAWPTSAPPPPRSSQGAPCVVPTLPVRLGLPLPSPSCGSRQPRPPQGHTLWTPVATTTDSVTSQVAKQDRSWHHGGGMAPSNQTGGEECTAQN